MLTVAHTRLLTPVVLFQFLQGGWCLGENSIWRGKGQRSLTRTALIRNVAQPASMNSHYALWRGPADMDICQTANVTASCISYEVGQEELLTLGVAGGLGGQVAKFTECLWFHPTLQASGWRPSPL